MSENEGLLDTFLATFFAAPQTAAQLEQTLGIRTGFLETSKPNCSFPSCRASSWTRGPRQLSRLHRAHASC